MQEFLQEKIAAADNQKNETDFQTNIQNQTERIKRNIARRFRDQPDNIITRTPENISGDKSDDQRFL